MDKARLQRLYDRGASMSDISREFKCSVHKVNYWMDKYGLERRSISDAIYIKHNPSGDPFKINKVNTID